MPVDDEIVNPSDNRPFADVLDARLSRRTVLAGGVAAAATTFIVGAGGTSIAGAARMPATEPLVGFTPAPIPADRTRPSPRSTSTTC